MAKFKRNNLQLKTNQKIQLGDSQESVIQYDGSNLKLTNDGGNVAVSGNLTMDSGKDVATEEYVQQQVGLGIETGNYNLSTGDTTAEIIFVQQQGSRNYGLGYSIINTVDNPPLLFVHGVFEQTASGFKVMFSSPMDTDNYKISWIVTDSQLGSSSSSSRSSSSKSSSSESSSSKSSSSTSSSSVSDAPFMGTGWPYLPDSIEVVIGTRWYFPNVYFVEDEVIYLYRAGEDSGEIAYTEDGTLTPDNTTNRLKMKVGLSNPTKVWWYLTPAREMNVTDVTWTTSAVYVGLTGYNPYDFQAFWDTDPSFNTYAKSSYFDVSTSESFSPYMKYQGEIFKSMSFFTYSSSSSSSSSRSSSSRSSSSSISELPFMGSGWPYPPDKLEVTIGSRWNEANVQFAEDDVIQLIRVDTGGSNAYFTEDGTLTGNFTTNRLRIMYQAGKMQAGVPNSFFSSLFYPAIDVTHGYNPYDFGEMFTNSFSFSYYAYPAYFNVTATDGFSPNALYNGEVFKTFTFIDN